MSQNNDRLKADYKHQIHLDVNQRSEFFVQIFL